MALSSWAEVPCIDQGVALLSRSMSDSCSLAIIDLATAGSDPHIAIGQFKLELQSGNNKLFNYLFRFRSKKISKLRVTGLCAENSPGTGEFSAQKGSNAENVFIWWSHHGRKITLTHSWLLSRSGWPGCDETLSWCVALPTRCIYQVSNWYLKACWKKVQKTFRWLGALLTPPSGCFCPQRAKNCPTMTKISRGQDTHFISVCTKSKASI